MHQRKVIWTMKSRPTPTRSETSGIHSCRCIDDVCSRFVTKQGKISSQGVSDMNDCESLEDRQWKS